MKVAEELATMSGVDWDKASPRQCEKWEARAAALQRLAVGDMDGANKIMAPYLPAKKDRPPG